MSKPIIVAIDETQPSSFKQIVDSLHSDLCMIKVGSVSFNAMGHEALTYVASKGFEIFLDLKLHDIPNTVKKPDKILHWKPSCNIDIALEKIIDWHKAYSNNQNMLEHAL